MSRLAKFAVHHNDADKAVGQFMLWTFAVIGFLDVCSGGTLWL